MRRGFLFFAMLAVGLLATGVGRAVPQHGSATLAGVVLTANGKPVPKASVTYQSAGGVAAHAVFTDAKGRFSVEKLRADDYDVRASAQGVYSDWQKNVSLRAGQTKTVTLRLTHPKEPPPDVPAKP